MSKKSAVWPRFLRTVAIATAGETGAKWNFSPLVAADAVLPRSGLQPKDKRVDEALRLLLTGRTGAVARELPPSNPANASSQ